MGLKKRFSLWGWWFKGLVFKIDKELQFDTTTNPSMDTTGGGWIHTIKTAIVDAFQIRDDITGESILNINADVKEFSIHDNYTLRAKGIQAFFLEAKGSFGTGGGWADQGFIGSDYPVLRFAPATTERAVYMFFAMTRFDFSQTKPAVGFMTYTTGLNIATDKVVWQLEARYLADGELTTAAAAETILVTQTLVTVGANMRQGLILFELDNTLLVDQDVIHFTLRRIGGDVNDTYGSDVAVGQSGLILKTQLYN